MGLLKVLRGVNCVITVEPSVSSENILSSQAPADTARTARWNKHE